MSTSESVNNFQKEKSYRERDMFICIYRYRIHMPYDK